MNRSVQKDHATSAKTSLRKCIRPFQKTELYLNVRGHDPALVLPRRRHRPHPPAAEVWRRVGDQLLVDRRQRRQRKRVLCDIRRDLLRRSPVTLNVIREKLNGCTVMVKKWITGCVDLPQAQGDRATLHATYGQYSLPFLFSVYRVLKINASREMERN